MARFGAIDIDDKQHSYKDFPFKKYLDIIQKYKLPLVPIKSKSGGMHLYVFLKEPIKAATIRNFLEKLLFALKLPIAHRHSFLLYCCSFSNHCVVGKKIGLSHSIK